MDIDSQDEEFSDLHVDLFPVQGYFTSQGNLSRNIFAGINGGSDELFKE